MPPKFQSSFIPKGPQASSFSAVAPSMRHHTDRSFFSTVAFFIFIASIIVAIGVFGYRFYLQYRIGQMNLDLSQARATLDPEIIKDITDLNSRIISTNTLVSNHMVIVPLFEFLEESTPVSVRFNDFTYEKTDKGLEISLLGEARGYAALALEAEILNKSRYFDDIIFSDLTLNESGDVIFSLRAVINPELLAYIAEEGSSALPFVPASTIATSTSSSNTQPR